MLDRSALLSTPSRNTSSNLVKALYADVLIRPDVLSTVMIDFRVGTSSDSTPRELPSEGAIACKMGIVDLGGFRARFASREIIRWVEPR